MKLDIVSFILVFFIVRSFLALAWNHGLSQMALDAVSKCKSSDEMDKAERIFLDWDCMGAILNPVHFDKWTTAQWYAYQKKQIEK